MSNTSARPVTEITSGTAATESSRLCGNMGTTSLVLSVLAFSAPLVTVAGYVSFAIGFVGQAAPLAWVVATAVLLIFAVGYTTMTRHIPRPGAFYTYISLGFGRVFGVGSAYLATVSYLAITAGIYAFAGTSLGSMVSMLHGPSAPWWVWALVTWVIVTVLGHFNVELSAKVLGVVMVFEIVVVVIFNVFTLVKGGAEGLSAAPLSPSAFINGGTGMALLFAFGNFIGFEATALFRDEVRTPNRTIPRATYISVALIGVLYAVSAYSLIIAYGPAAAQDSANSAPGDMFHDALSLYVAPAVSQVAILLVTTSALASVLSVHNVSARYLFNLGADRALPHALAAVHTRHKSPHRASLVAAIIVLLMVSPFALASSDPGFLQGTGSGIGTAGVLILMAMVSLAVVAYFARRGRPAGESRWNVLVAPILAFLGLAAVVVFAIARFDLLVGGAPGENLWMLLVLLAFVALGCAVALYYRVKRPDLYARLGRHADSDPIEAELVDQ
ncbi:APC family permease [Kineococcus aurantiacus]|uniref:Amino acid transporter n=1 Tax=Kineococcus aurantiacus TaxID=37633 RepID=A0A7Y9DR52_9ACTN|nr:APC family permease [Kineococcus aurantiacus]NYD25153.1 amino acid transporter [Kineococcus aurantiacus]